ncbi:MAG: hypothetical protein IKU72_03125 [Oscillospiraceae bacterium]|nr:hypothetical protein [Oscillospiraceae bacterium]
MDFSNLPNEMLERMLAVARLYYLEKMSQQAISEKLNISRSWVSKLLTRAEELGMVRIEIVSPFEETRTVEQLLKEKYKADIHVTTHSSDMDVFTAAIGFLTAQLRPYDVVAVGAGTSVSRVISMSGSYLFPDVTVVPMAGNYGTNAAVYPNYNAVRLAENLHSKVRVIDAPAVCRTQEEYDVLINNPETRQTLQMAEHPDIMLVGMNTREWSSKSRYAIIPPQETELLVDRKTIGDVTLNYFDEKGQTVTTPSMSRWMRADLLQASRHARTSIGVAIGAQKANIIHLALSRRLINTLFTNQETAQALLKV